MTAPLDNLTTKAEAGADDKREAGSKPTTGGSGYAARAGQTIRGNLARGGDGKFTAAGNASAKKPAAKPTGRVSQQLQGKKKPAAKPKKGAAAPKPKKGPDPARAAEREQRRREAAARRAKREADAKTRAAAQQQAKLDRAVAAEGKRRDALAKREQHYAAQQQRAAERAARRTQAEAAKRLAQQQPKAGGGKGGGGGGGKKPADKGGQATANRATIGTALGVSADALAGLADGAQPPADAAPALESAGLISKQRDGSYATTAAGRAFLNAAEAGNERQARAMLARGRDQQAARVAPRGRTEARPRSGESRRAKSFAVFKDAGGRDCWLAVSSTAFQDRDGEIVSVQALKDDVARSDGTGDYGPLRFWHIPGFDIGRCDFRAVAGRSLIEAGPFTRPEYAAAVKATDQVSLGFLHPVGQPDAAGVFTTIHTFERSIVPAGRASNPFTRLTIKEANVMTDEKRKEAEARFGPAVVAAILGEVEQTEKAADAAGVRHKEGPPIGAVATWDGATWVYAEKAADAPPDMVSEEPPAEIEQGDDLAEEPGGYFSPEELAEISAAVAPAVAEAVLAALMPALDMEAKMSKWADEVKGAMGGYTATKDAQAAATTEALKAATDTAAALEARIKDLEGEVPAGIAGGYRPSVSNPPPAVTTKTAGPVVDPELAAFFALGQS